MDILLVEAHDRAQLEAELDNDEAVRKLLYQRQCQISTGSFLPFLQDKLLPLSWFYVPGINQETKKAAHFLFSTMILSTGEQVYEQSPIALLASGNSHAIRFDVFYVSRMPTDLRTYYGCFTFPYKLR